MLCKTAIKTHFRIHRSHDKVRHVDGGGGWDIFKYYKRLISTIISRPLGRNEEEELQEAVANTGLEIMENSQTEVLNGDKKPRQKRWQFDGSECCCCKGNKSAKI